MEPIEVFTDGSCNTQYSIGGWSAIIISRDKKIDLHGTECNTTNQRMELTAVLEALKYLIKNVNFNKYQIHIYTDSEYIVNLRKRKEKLIQKDYLTNKGVLIRNADLVQMLYSYIEKYPVQFSKIKGHQKVTDKPDYNREADKLSRKLVRKKVAAYQQN